MAHLETPILAPIEQEEKKSLEPGIPSEQHTIEEGYEPSLFQDPELAKKLFSCGLCLKVARKAVELSCPSHEEDLKLSIFCETCLCKYLKENNGKCPATDHPNATYDKNRSLRRQILSMDVICPHTKPQFRV